jgi:hypothetical protein
MTVKLKPALPDGTIRGQDAEEDFRDFVNGRPLKRRMMLVEVEIGGIEGNTIEKGRVTGNKYVVVHAAEIRDPHEVDLSRHRISQIRGEGGMYAKQPALFDATDAEKRDTLLDLIKDRASSLDLALADVDKQWVDYFGGVENAAAETVQASRSLTQLQEFAYVFGALDDKKAGSTDEGTDLESDQDDPDEDPEEPTGPESSGPALQSVPFTEATDQ